MYHLLYASKCAWKTAQVRRCTHGQFESIRLVPCERATSIKSKKRFLILKYLNFAIRFYQTEYTLCCFQPTGNWTWSSCLSCSIVEMFFIIYPMISNISLGKPFFAIKIIPISIFGLTVGMTEITSGSCFII